MGRLRLGQHLSRARSRHAGGATWSIMGAGLGDASGYDTDHEGTTLDITALGVSGFTLSNYESMIDAALDAWADASGFENLGQVADGGGFAGASGIGETGEIRIGAWNIDSPTVLAHAYQPGNESLLGSGGSIAGDVHIDAGWNWVDNPNDLSGGGDYDLFTILLHELGHALGLGHSNKAGSVMRPVYAGAQRTLGSDDIQGIVALYGPGDNGGNDGGGSSGGKPSWAGNGGRNNSNGLANVPEPSAVVLGLMTLAALAITRRR